MLQAVVLYRPCELHARRSVLSQDDTGKDLFVAHGVRCGDHRDLGHRGMLGEYCFHLERSDVLAGAADDVLPPVDEVELAIVAAVHRVAGVEPAAVPGFLGRCRILEVPGEEAAPRIASFLPDQQLRAMFVNLYFQICRWTTEASRADMARLAARGDHCAAAGLGHGPGLDQGEAEPGFERGVVFGVRVCAEAETDAMRAVRGGSFPGKQDGGHDPQIMHDGGARGSDVAPPGLRM